MTARSSARAQAIFEDNSSRWIQDLPAAPGAYALILRLKDATPVSTAAHGPGTLAPGCYVYAGSARGPGGIRARVRRHLRPNKTPH